MKLRLKSNHLRLKISEKDLNLFTVQNHLETTVDFGNDTRLKYILKSKQISKPEATFLDNCIIIYFPESKIATFKNTALSNIDNHPVESGKLYIKIEKDFQHNQKSKSDDGNNSFTNPLLIDLVD